MSIHVHIKQNNKKPIYGKIMGSAEDGRMCEATIGPNGYTTCTLRNTTHKERSNNLKTSTYPTQAKFELQTNYGNCTLYGELKENIATITKGGECGDLITNYGTADNQNRNCGFNVNLQGCGDYGQKECHVGISTKDVKRKRNPNRIMEQKD